MLIINVAETELFDEANDTFVTAPAVKLKLEHSLVSLAAWESKWEKPFLSDEQHTYEETVSYIQFMCIKPSVTEDTLGRISSEQFKEINNYIEAKMTATWFKELPGASRMNKEVITAEIIYYWMTALNVPLEWESRHLNRLFTLIKVLNEKNKPAKKQPRSTTLEQHRSINEARRAQYAKKG